jgi:hypothetical protein
MLYCPAAIFIVAAVVYPGMEPWARAEIIPE